MDYKIGDKLKSKVNPFHDGYYLVIAVTDNKITIEAYENNGKPSFGDGKYGVYKYSESRLSRCTYKI